MIEATLAIAALTAADRLREALAPQPASIGAAVALGALAGLAALATWLTATGSLTKAGRRDRALRLSLRKYPNDRNGWSTIAKLTVQQGGPIFAMAVDAKVKRNGHGALDLRVRRSDRDHPTFTRTTPEQGLAALTTADLGIPASGDRHQAVALIDLGHPYPAHIHLDLREDLAA